MSQIITPAAVTRVIDELEFITIPFHAYYALGLLGRIGQSAQAAGVDPNAKLGGAGMGMLDQAVILELLKQTHVWLDDNSGKGPRKFEITTQANFDKVFTGRLKTMFKVVQFVCETNFDVFDDGSASEPAAR